MQELAVGVRRWLGEGKPAVIGRVLDIQGFSTWPGDELVAFAPGGEHVGELLGRTGAEQLGAAAAALLAEPDPGLTLVTVTVRGAAVAEAGLSCGGQAEVLLQPAATVPAVLWDLLAARAPVALLTRIEGPGAGPAAIVADGAGRSWGTLGPAGSGGDPGWAGRARDVLAGGHRATQRLDDGEATVLLEAWVPSPRLVVVGGGDLAAAIAAQAALLGWETSVSADPADVSGLLKWAGDSSALVVLSHDPHVDTAALATGLVAGTPYVGALGSRATQSRRLERLAASGVDPASLERIHRPIGLDLGGRSAPEVALAIVAEILAGHCGRDARPLRERSGPINDRTSASAVT